MSTALNLKQQYVVPPKVKQLKYAFLVSVESKKSNLALHSRVGGNQSISVVFQSPGRSIDAGSAMILTFS